MLAAREERGTIRTPSLVDRLDVPPFDLRCQAVDPNRLALSLEQWEAAPAEVHVLGTQRILKREPSTLALEADHHRDEKAFGRAKSVVASLLFSRPVATVPPIESFLEIA